MESKPKIPSSLPKPISGREDKGLGPEETKWVFRWESEGKMLYSVCMELQDLMALVEKKKLEGVFCVAAIIPDFKCEAKVNFDFSKSNYIK